MNGRAASFDAAQIQSLLGAAAHGFNAIVVAQNGALTPPAPKSSSPAPSTPDINESKLSSDLQVDYIGGSAGLAQTFTKGTSIKEVVEWATQPNHVAYAVAGSTQDAAAVMKAWTENSTVMGILRQQNAGTDHNFLVDTTNPFTVTNDQPNYSNGTMASFQPQLHGAPSASEMIAFHKFAAGIGIPVGVNPGLQSTSVPPQGQDAIDSVSVSPTGQVTVSPLITASMSAADTGKENAAITGWRKQMDEAIATGQTSPIPNPATQSDVTISGATGQSETVHGSTIAAAVAQADRQLELRGAGMSDNGRPVDPLTISGTTNGKPVSFDAAEVKLMLDAAGQGRNSVAIVQNGSPSPDRTPAVKGKVDPRTPG
jgi:hypothetical protein